MALALIRVWLAALILAAVGALGLAAEPPAARADEQESAAASPNWAALAARRLPQLELCQPTGVAEPVLCGSLEVPENRERPNGRRIGLNIVVVPAQTETPPDDPVFVFEGGPGGAVTKRAGGSVWAGPVRARDIVLVDQRGTGASGPIDCDLGGGLGTEPGRLREMFPAEDVRSCAAELSKRADLALYTSEHHADDIEDVRRHLGYGPINLRGGSYGTAAMMVFAQRYPESTRSLFGIGMTSPTRSNLAERGTMTEQALHRLTLFCQSDPSCAELTSDLFSTVSVALSSLDEEPRNVEVSDPSDPGKILHVAVSRDWIAEITRLNLYFAFTSRALPWAYRRALEDNWAPLTQLGVLIERMFQSSLSYGVLLSVQCSEGMNFDIDEALQTGSQTLFGNYRLEQQIQGCAEWPHVAKPTLGKAEPDTLDIPALFLSGAMDPVTPPDYAEDARLLFPNSLHVVLEEGQHGPFDLDNAWECVHGLWADFLDQGSPGGLDVSCTEALHRPPFIRNAEEFDTYIAEVLLPMIG